MATRQEVVEFLSAFKAAMEFGQFHLKDREKNLQALVDLGLTVNEMRETIGRLTVEDYSAGPEPDDTDATKEVWFFGCDVEGEEVYIKLRLAPVPGRQHVQAATVWSFHPAERRIRYPFRQGQS